MSGLKGSELYPPAKFTAEDVAFLQPPPSYEEVMGVYQTSIALEQPDLLPQLAYIDIMPRCLNPGDIKQQIPPKFDDFSAIMGGANRWLLDNSSMAVWKCETVEKQIGVDAAGNLTYDLNSMLRHDSTFGFNVYVVGLRMWLTKKTNNSSPPQELGLRNVLPEKVVIEMPTRGHYRRGRIIIGDEIQMMGGYNTFETLEGLEATMQKLNSRLQSDPIPGTILTIETAKLKAFDMFKKDMDPERSCWSENKEKMRRITQVIRIFYVKGPSAKEQIGLQEFEPRMSQRGDAIKQPRFEPFDNLMPEISQWLPSNQGARIVNFQQYDARYVKNLFTGEADVSSDSTDESISAYGGKEVLKVLRVFYTISPAQGAPAPAGCITSRLFLPAKTGRKSVESMTKTMARIDAWLQVTGMPIYSVETIQLLHAESHPLGADANKSNYSIMSSGKHWITAIRVYFASSYTEPDPALLPPPPKGSGSGSGSCAIL